MVLTLKPEGLLEFYAYTTKTGKNLLASALVEFDEIHLELPLELPGVSPPKAETPNLRLYEEIVKALERASSVQKRIFTGSSPSDNPEEDIKRLDELVGKAISLEKQINLSKKAKKIVSERKKRLSEVESELSDVEEKLRRYYATALETVSKDPSKMKIARLIVEADSEILRSLSLLNASLDKSTSMDDMKIILNNVIRTTDNIKGKLRKISESIAEGNLDLLISKTEDIENSLKDIISSVGEYLTLSGKFSQLESLEKMWERISDVSKRMPEIQLMISEQVPTVRRISQEKEEVARRMNELVDIIRTKVKSSVDQMDSLYRSFRELRECVVSVDVLIAGEAEKSIYEMLEKSQPLLAEREKVELELSELSKLMDKEHVDKLKKELENIKREISEVASRLYKTKEVIRHKAVEEKVSLMIYEGSDIVVAHGWVPKSLASSLKSHLERSMGGLVAVELETPSRKEKPPSRVKLPKMALPVSLLTHKLYGFPNIKEIDPTVITSFLFPLMFGMMFGDMGHGALVAIFGLFLLLKTKGSLRDLGGILLYSGIFATIFGYLYGAAFFVELGTHVLSPIKEPTRLFGIALLIGAFEILLAFIIRTINKILSGDKFAAFMEYGGVLTIAMYSGAVYAAIRNGADVMKTVSDPLFQAMVIPLLITGVAPMLRSMMEGHGILHGMPEMVSTFIESTLALFSNSLSFIRLAAFAVAHETFGVLAGMFTVGSTSITPENLMHLLTNPISLVTFIFINIAVIGLEGLLSFIQAMRLTFYEFFTKFYSANGRPFLRVRELISS
ncbi:MAG: V-type ATPase 116kDa subunit family protein [Candidatus Methanodesulfokora sp.]